jgi:hypothetical protein
VAANELLRDQKHPHEISGHPSSIWETDEGPKLVTLCAGCGRLRSIIFLDRDRWFCMQCKSEGAHAPNLYPIA